MPMRRMMFALTLLTGLAAPTFAHSACPPKLDDSFSTEAMIGNPPLRADALDVLNACADAALDQVRAKGDADDALIGRVATLAGRLAVASYASDELPATSPAVAALLEAAFNPIYARIKALPEQENAAVMRALFFHMASQAAPRTTGSVR